MTAPGRTVVESGVAELGCVFARAEGETWITTRYEPRYRIDYAIVRPHLTAGALAFTLTPHAPPTARALSS